MKTRSLFELKIGERALVVSIDSKILDSDAQRLRSLGLMEGETVLMVSKAPISRDPIVVVVQETRIALRKSDAELIYLGDESSPVSFF